MLPSASSSAPRDEEALHFRRLRSSTTGLLERWPRYERYISLLKPVVVGLLLLGLIGCAGRPNVFTESRDERVRRLNQERARLEATTNPVARTRVQILISDLLVSFVGDAVIAGDVELIEEYVKEYRAAVIDARDSMVNSGRNALNDASGYRDLEIALRQHLRQLDDIGARLSFERRQPLDQLIDEVSEIRGEMLDILFPARDATL